jgi:hypothetical protein
MGKMGKTGSGSEKFFNRSQTRKAGPIGFYEQRAQGHTLYVAMVQSCTFGRFGTNTVGKVDDWLGRLLHPREPQPGKEAT